MKLTLILLCAAVLAGCSTIEGFGRDLSAGARVVGDAF